MASFITSNKTNETGSYPECHTTTERANTGKDQKVNTILRGNGAKPKKSQFIHLILKLINCASLKR